MSVKHILLVVDHGNWAWAHKAAALKKYLENDCVKIKIIRLIELLRRKDDVSEFHHIHFFMYDGNVLDITGVNLDKISTTVASHKFIHYKKQDLARRNLMCFKKILCVSPFLHDELLKTFGKLGKIYKCYNGVDETLFFPIERKCPIKRKIVVGWSGVVKRNSIMDKHGYEILLKVMKIIGRNGDRATHFKFEINTNRAKTAIPFEKMNEMFYNKVDVMLHTGISTGTPNTIYEAGAAGCAVMGTHIGCMGELITDGVDGFLFEVDFSAAAKQHTKAYKAYVRNCAKQIVEKLYYFDNNRAEIEKFGVKIREEILDKWTWKKRAQDWKEVLDL